ncbi:AMP-binding protein [Aquicoccus sp. SCR17]|nr:AMP-binding protein [Carideicomes alvinocaridis]
MSSNLSVWEADGSGPALREITLGDALDEQAAARGEAPALIFDEFGVHWSWAEMKARADRLARGLMAWGVAAGDRVAVLSPNAPEWVLLEYALAKVGATLVTVNPALRESELDYVLRQSRSSALFTVCGYRNYDLAAAITAIRSRLPGLSRVARMGEGDLPDAPAFAEVEAMADKVNAEALAERQAGVKPGDIVQIQYTSGTTGNPKGAMLTHRSTVNNGRLMALRAGFRPEDRLVSAMPFFHTAGCVCNVMGMLAVGGCHVGLSAFDAEKMLEQIEKHRGTVTNSVPTMLIRMLEEPSMPDRDLSSWRICFVGGTDIPPSLMRRMKEQVGTDPMIIMGMTECSPIITQTEPSDDFETQIATAGTPLPHTEIKVVDPETRDPVPLGESGELMIRGYLTTAGYFDMPEKTAETLDAEGWLKSGDLAVLDEGGYLRIVGRIKDMLIRGGENVYPAEIEAFLMTHPDISDAQVVGVPDPQMGEEIFAFVIPRPGATLDPQIVRDFCREGLARHKLPKYVELTDAFPQTANGKIRKVELRETAAKRVAESAA